MDPFAEPTDTESTMIRPRPSGTGGREPQPAQRAPQAAEARPIPRTGTSPLVAAAAPVLAAVVRVASGRTRPPDPDRLRRAMVDAVRRFETDALATGLDTRSLRAARYALCATIDDVVLSTPWGSSSSWVQQTITSVFHNEVIGGDRFFDILEQMQKDLGRHEPVVELMYICMSVGFEGRYRVMPRGAAAQTELRDGVYRTIRQRRGDFERELSPHWRGVAAGARPLSQRIPLWAMGLGTAVLAAGMYVAFTLLLASRSDLAFAELLALQPRVPQQVVRTRPPVLAPSTPTPPPTAPSTPSAPPPPSSLVEKLRGFLEPEIRAGLVVVLEDAQSVTVRLTNRNMFASGKAELPGSYTGLLQRIGEALEGERGRVLVNGYTDSQPTRTAQFPSNFELSRARADATAAVIRPKLSHPARLVVTGKGEADPIASNATADGRQQNRRTEIVLLREGDGL